MIFKFLERRVLLECKLCARAVSILENDQTRDRWLDFRRMQVASDQITFLVESSDDITQDSEVLVPVRIVLDSVSLTRSYKEE